MKFNKKTLVIISVLTSTLSSFVVKATPSSSVIENKVIKTYPAHTSFKEILLSGNDIPCAEGKNWSVAWAAKDDIYLPANVDVNGDFAQAITKVYFSFFDNQDKIINKSFITDRLEIEGCSITFTDKTSAP